MQPASQLPLKPTSREPRSDVVWERLWCITSPAATRTPVNKVAENGSSLTQGACRNTGSTTMAAAMRATGKDHDRAGADVCQVPPIKCPL